jgi:CheY-like chemotaxis protein
VLWNILRNAINFTESGGEIMVQTTNDGERIAISVEDSGIGMSRETLDKLFTPFEQADRRRSGRYGRLGLGMAISNALVQLMGGTLTAESEGFGHGSKFTITLQTTDETEASAGSPHVAPAMAEKLRVLLVEDHVDTAVALGRMLRSRGHDAQIASSVRAALDLLREHEFDLLLCDLGLPDGDGYELIKQVRSHSRIPAIALTGYAMSSDVEQARKAGFDVHLTKPVDYYKLESTMARLMKEARSAAPRSTTS